MQVCRERVTSTFLFQLVPQLIGWYPEGQPHCRGQSAFIPRSIDLNANLFQKHLHGHTHKSCLTTYLNILWSSWHIKLTMTARMGQRHGEIYFFSSFCENDLQKSNVIAELNKSSKLLKSYIPHFCKQNRITLHMHLN